MLRSKRPLPRAPSDAPAPRTLFLRFAFAFLASILASGYLAAVTHLTFVAHARCAEHDALVHVAPAAHPAVATDAPRSSTTAIESTGAPAADEHDHCVLGMAQPADARVAEPARLLLPHPEPQVAAPLPAVCAPGDAVAPPPPIALLHLSPKSSPPA
ncbi:MAG: hypothetical protein R3B70_40915 [Polyangiaceae bacterium]